MVAVASLLVLVCAFVINAQSLKEACVATEIGALSGTPVPLDQVFLSPNTRDWRVTIPPVPQCIYGVNGVKTIVCDYDQPPSATFQSLNLLYVHRTGQLQGLGTVQVTVYCNVGQLDSSQNLQNLLLQPY